MPFSHAYCLGCLFFFAKSDIAIVAIKCDKCVKNSHSAQRSIAAVSQK